MRVLVDLHHFDLFHSFQRLFEGRLGWEVYRPIGLDWYAAGCWLLSEEPTVRTGYLSQISGACRASLLPYWKERDASWARFATELVRIGPIVQTNPETYEIQDLSKPGVNQRGITFDGFKQNRFDLLISSVPQHFYPFERLRECYQPHAKHVFHNGNVVWKLPPKVQNVMTNVSLIEHWDGLLHSVEYDQEFDLGTFPSTPGRIGTLGDEILVRSYVHFPQSEALWKAVGLGPDTRWTFEWIGRTLASLDETIVESSALALSMQRAHFIWHIKPGGEGFGHILFNTFATGRPVIINAQDYGRTRGEHLLEDQVTCIDVSSRSPEEVRNLLLEAAEPERYQAYCTAVTERFRNVVNFDADTKKIKRFLENLR